MIRERARRRAEWHAHCDEVNRQCARRHAIATLMDIVVFSSIAYVVVCGVGAWFGKEE